MFSIPRSSKVGLLGIMYHYQAFHSTDDIDLCADDGVWGGEDFFSMVKMLMVTMLQILVDKMMRKLLKMYNTGEGDEHAADNNDNDC